MTALPSFATQSVVVWRAPTITDHGADIPDWGNAVDHVQPGCSVQPAGGATDRTNRDATTTLWTVFAPIAADIVDTDQVEVFGIRYEIDGPIKRWATGILDHLEVPLRNTQG